MPEELAAMADDGEQLNSEIDRAVAGGQLMESAVKNIHALLGGTSSNLYLRSVSQLIDAAEWSELNDRFYQTLAFGTGGLRGQHIGTRLNHTTAPDSCSPRRCGSARRRQRFRP